MVAAAIVIAAPGLPAVVSLLVLTCQRLAAGVPAAPEVTPTIWNERTVPLAMTQLLADVGERDRDGLAGARRAIAVHLSEALVRMIVGVAGTEKTDVAFGKTTVIVSPRAQVARPLETVKPTVQVARALAASVRRGERHGGRSPRGVDRDRGRVARRSCRRSC